MSAVLICPKPGCRSESTGSFCKRCGTDLSRIVCQGCGKDFPEGDLATREGPACDECGGALAPRVVLVAPPGRPALDAGALACDGRIRTLGSLAPDQYLAIDCRPNLKRLVWPLPDGSPAAAHRKLSHLAGMPVLLDAVPDPGGGAYLLLAGPLDRDGALYPALADRWSAASTQRRLSWLSAWTHLAIALSAEGWSRSVLELANLRVTPDGTLALCTLLADEGPGSPAERLARLWQSLCGTGDAAVPDLARRLEAGATGLGDAERELLALRSSPRTEVRHHGATDVGRKRENNEDSFLGWQASVKDMRPEGAGIGVRGLFAVCDGMGGHERGEVAARTCIQMLQRHVVPVLMTEDPGDGDLAGALRRLVKEDINAAILARNGGEQEGPFRRMGTTVVMVAVCDDRAVWAHVGDSRIYLITRQRIDQITEDHNVGTRDVKLGVATMLQAFRSPVGKHLTQALGPRGSEFVHPDTGEIALDLPCYLLLCSDGLADMVPEPDAHRIVLQNWDDPAAVVSSLISLANEGGGLDNITALAIRVEPLSPAFAPGPSDVVEQPQRV